MFSQEWFTNLSMQKHWQVRSMYRVVHLNLTPEIEIFYKLLERYISFFSMTSLNHHMEYFQLDLPVLFLILWEHIVCANQVQLSVWERNTNRSSKSYRTDNIFEAMNERTPSKTRQLKGRLNVTFQHPSKGIIHFLSFLFQSSAIFKSTSAKCSTSKK